MSQDQFPLAHPPQVSIPKPLPLVVSKSAWMAKQIMEVDFHMRCGADYELLFDEHQLRGQTRGREVWFVGPYFERPDAERL